MGYTITAPIRSWVAKQRMMSFLDKNFDRMGDAYIRGPLGSDLSYDHHSMRIGFDGTLINDYMVGVCAWVALKVGRRYTYPTKLCPKIHGVYKTLWYDGATPWPLYVTSRYRKDCPQLVQVDWTGCLVPPPVRFPSPAGPPLIVIHDELARLDSLWQKENNVKEAPDIRRCKNDSDQRRA
jgi:hypothetical protein